MNLGETCEARHPEPDFNSAPLLPRHSFFRAFNRSTPLCGSDPTVLHSSMFPLVQGSKKRPSLAGGSSVSFQLVASFPELLRASNCVVAARRERASRGGSYGSRSRAIALNVLVRGLRVGFAGGVMELW